MKPQILFISLLSVTVLLPSCGTTHYYSSKEQLKTATSFPKDVNSQFIEEARQREPSYQLYLSGISTGSDSIRANNAIALADTAGEIDLRNVSLIANEPESVKEYPLLFHSGQKRKQGFFEKFKTKIALKLLPILLRKKTSRMPSLHNPEECDIIVFRNGNEVKAKVTEIGTDEIKYKRCDYLTGPVMSVKKSEVFMIKYANGEKEVFELKETEPVKTQPATTTTTAVSSRPIDHPKATGALVAGVIGLFIFPLFAGIAAVVLGNRVSRDASENPGKYTETSIRRGRTGVILGYISIFWVLILILALSIA